MDNLEQTNHELQNKLDVLNENFISSNDKIKEQEERISDNEKK